MQRLLRASLTCSIVAYYWQQRLCYFRHSCLGAVRYETVRDKYMAERIQSLTFSAEIPLYYQVPAGQQMVMEESHRYYRTKHCSDERLTTSKCPSLYSFCKQVMVRREWVLLILRELVFIKCQLLFVDKIRCYRFSSMQTIYN